MSAPDPKCPACKGEGVVYEKQASNFFPGSIARAGKISDCMKAMVQAAEAKTVAKIAETGANVLITFERKLEKANA
jgi:hypothetical protein